MADMGLQIRRTRQSEVDGHRRAPRHAAEPLARVEPTPAAPTPVEGEDRGPLFQDWSDQPQRQRHSRLRAVVLWLLACLLVLLVAVAGTLFYVERRIDDNLERFDAFAGLEDRPARPSGPAGSALNLLLIGTDRGATASAAGEAAPTPDGAQTSDALMLIHIDADRDGAAVISLPRDSWVQVPGRGPATINTTYADGGPPLTVATVEQLTGVRIDHVAIIDWAGFTELTDAVGGVEITVPETSHDPDQDITWTPGRHRLSGEEALAYVRQRRGLPGGDLDRVRRQQVFLRTLADGSFRTLLGGGPMSFLDVVDGATRHMAVDQDWSTRAMGRLAFSLRDLDPDAVDFLTAPVAGTGEVAGADVVHLDQGRGSEMWGELRADRLDRWTAAHASELTGDVVR